MLNIRKKKLGDGENEREKTAILGIRKESVMAA